MAASPLGGFAGGSYNLASTARGSSDAQSTNTSNNSGWNVSTGGSKLQAGDGKLLMYAGIALAVVAVLYLIANRKG